jgi:hypothetical protein
MLLERLNRGKQVYATHQQLAVYLHFAFDEDVSLEVPCIYRALSEYPGTIRAERRQPVPAGADRPDTIVGVADADHTGLRLGLGVDRHAGVAERRQPVPAGADRPHTIT